MKRQLPWMTFRLLARPMWVAWAYTFFIFAGLETVFRLIDAFNLDALNDSLALITLYTVTALPARLYEYAPLITLIGTAAGTGLLAQHSELTILRAAGWSRSGITFAILVIFSPLYIGAAVMSEYVIPHTERIHRSLDPSSQLLSVGTWTREGTDIMNHQFSQTGEITGRLTFRLVDDFSSIKSLQYNTSTDSKTSESGTRVHFEEDRLEFEALKTGAYSERSDILRVLRFPPEVLSTSELWSAYSYLQSRGVNSRHYGQRYWQHRLIPIVYMMVIGLAVMTAFGSLREADLASRVFLAVVVGLAYRYATEIATPFVFLMQWSPVVSVLLPMMLPIGLMLMFSRRY